MTLYTYADCNKLYQLKLDAAIPKHEINKQIHKSRQSPMNSQMDALSVGRSTFLLATSVQQQLLPITSEIAQA